MRQPYNKREAMRLLVRENLSYPYACKSADLTLLHSGTKRFPKKIVW
jgi:hypothetical protein